MGEQVESTGLKTLDFLSGHAIVTDIRASTRFDRGLKGLIA
jgi:hypothetical protein